MAFPEIPTDAVKPGDPSAQASPSVVKTLLVIVGVWLAVTAAIVVVGLSGPERFPVGWRLAMLQGAAVLGFVAMAIAGVVAILVREGRRKGP